MEHWMSRARARRAKLKESIPQEWRLNKIPEGDVNAVEYILQCGLLTDVELEITETVHASALLDKIALQEYSSAQVARAFFKRTALVQQLTGCCTEIFFEEGLKQAEELDKHLKDSSTLKGLFHGLPVAVKDHFNVKGPDTTDGMDTVNDK